MQRNAPAVLYMLFIAAGCLREKTLYQGGHEPTDALIAGN